MTCQDQEGAVGQEQGNQVRYDRQSHSQGRTGVAALAMTMTASQAQDEPQCRCGGVAYGKSDQVALWGSVLGQQGEPEQGSSQRGCQ